MRRRRKKRNIGVWLNVDFHTAQGAHTHTHTQRSWPCHMIFILLLKIKHSVAQTAEFNWVCCYCLFTHRPHLLLFCYTCKYNWVRAHFSHEWQLFEGHDKTWLNDQLLYANLHEFDCLEFSSRFTNIPYLMRCWCECSNCRVICRLW